MRSAGSVSSPDWGFARPIEATLRRDIGRMDRDVASMLCAGLPSYGRRPTCCIAVAVPTGAVSSSSLSRPVRRGGQHEYSGHPPGGLVAPGPARHACVRCRPSRPPRVRGLSPGVRWPARQAPARPVASARHDQPCRHPRHAGGRPVEHRGCVQTERPARGRRGPSGRVRRVRRVDRRDGRADVHREPPRRAGTSTTARIRARRSATDAGSSPGTGSMSAAAAPATAAMSSHAAVSTRPA